MNSAHAAIMAVLKSWTRRQRALAAHVGSADVSEAAHGEDEVGDDPSGEKGGTRGTQRGAEDGANTWRAGDEDFEKSSTSPYSSEEDDHEGDDEDGGSPPIIRRPPDAAADGGPVAVAGVTASPWADPEPYSEAREAALTDVVVVLLKAVRRLCMDPNSLTPLQQAGAIKTLAYLMRVAPSVRSLQGGLRPPHFPLTSFPRSPLPAPFPPR